MSSSWFENTEGWANIEQGDIIFDCKVLELYYDTNGKLSAKEINTNVIVLTQSCDLENNKVSSIILCPVFKLSGIIRNKNKNGMNEKDLEKVVKQLKNGQQLNLFLLEKNEVSGDYLVVDFREAMTMPKDILFEHNKDNTMHLRLKTPYREALSQSFARFFMRVALPSGVLINEKDYVTKILSENET